ncbi:MAG: D-alanyl-D-alanine carboxypeptidase [Firmicutes bacterium]|nr:D-alanyl-D-alanine carboxypeptidase [Bacillota bacterium]
MKINKRHFFSLLFCCLLFCFFAHASETEAAMQITSNNAILVDAKTGQILYGKNPYSLGSSGDFNKLLTIITVLEEFDELPDNITVSGTAITYNPTPPYLGLKDGQVVNTMDMLYAMYLGGYNDAANVVADVLGRTLLDTSSPEYQRMTEMERTNAAADAFAILMNQKADEILCPTMKSTNPDGHFYDTQQCSPNDIACLIRWAVRNDTFRKLFMTPTYTITGNPKSVNNQHADTEDKYDRAKEKLGEDADKDELPPKPIMNYPYVSETYSLEDTNQRFEITTTNKLFSGEILYSGITGGICAYNKSLEKYHCMVYAKNGDRSLIAVVMNGDEELIYDDIQALLNFGFYKWTDTSISEKKLESMLPNNIASKNLAFNGRMNFALPADYTVKDLDAAVSYTENGYLSGTITLTLPDSASYAGTVTTVSFYERNERSIWGPVLKIIGIVLGIVLIIIAIIFLRRIFGTQSHKHKANLHRIRKTAKKEKEKQTRKNNDEPIWEQPHHNGLYTDPFGEKDRSAQKEKSGNRRKAEEVKKKKAAKKRSNRRKTNNQR